MVHYIVITGGVISGLGKGITTASIGKILQLHGYKVTAMKIDPYMNCDAGTLRPTEHGEVWVTEDGGEIDQDLGHYERFLDINISKYHNITTGQVYGAVIDKERKGKYLGKTVQPIPHVTNEIKDRIRTITKKSKVDVTIVEIGGTVGDIESLPFLEAARQMRLEEGSRNVINVHVTLVPVLEAVGEQKTKPTQHSVGTLRQIGITPDIIICRTEKSLTKEAREKIALFCNVDREAVIPAVDVKSIYELPLKLQNEGLDGIIVRLFNLKSQDSDLSSWEDQVIKRLKHPKGAVQIAVVGKYITLQDAYKSIYEALVHGAIACESIKIAVTSTSIHINEL